MGSMSLPEILTGGSSSAMRHRIWVVAGVGSKLSAALGPGLMILTCYLVCSFPILEQPTHPHPATRCTCAGWAGAPPSFLESNRFSKEGVKV